MQQERRRRSIIAFWVGFAILALSAFVSSNANAMDSSLWDAISGTSSGSTSGGYTKNCAVCPLQQDCVALCGSPADCSGACSDPTDPSCSSCTSGNDAIAACINECNADNARRQNCWDLCNNMPGGPGSGGTGGTGGSGTGGGDCTTSNDATGCYCYLIAGVSGCLTTTPCSAGTCTYDPVAGTVTDNATGVVSPATPATGGGSTGGGSGGSGGMGSGGSAMGSDPTPSSGSGMGMDNFCDWCPAPQLCCVTVKMTEDFEFTVEMQVWYIWYYFTQMKPDMMDMATRWADSFLIEAAMIGGFFDAQAHSDSLRSLQRMTAEAMRDYMPGEALCQFGTLSRTLASTSAFNTRTKLRYSTQAIQRQMVRKGSNPAEAQAVKREPGRSADRLGRWAQYVGKFCDKTNEDNGLDGVCSGGNNIFFNRDVDYARAFDDPRSFRETIEEPALFGLMNNLYAQNIALNTPDTDKMSVGGKSEGVNTWLDLRSAAAKRSVATNSFAAIAAMKTATPNSTTQMKAVAPFVVQIMKNLNFSNTDITKRFVMESGVSYFGQMEALTKFIYQDPHFFIELQDKPANVERQQTSMKAIQLMQERDMFESLQRSELLLSTLLELYLVKEQQKVGDNTTRN